MQLIALWGPHSNCPFLPRELRLPCRHRVVVVLPGCPPCDSGSLSSPGCIGQVLSLSGPLTFCLAGPRRTCLTGALPTLMPCPRSEVKRSSEVTDPGGACEMEGHIPIAMPGFCSHLPFHHPGKYFWQLTWVQYLMSLKPAQIHCFWRGLPLHLDSVDAMYERTSNHKTVFFKGE